MEEKRMRKMVVYQDFDTENPDRQFRIMFFNDGSAKLVFYSPERELETVSLSDVVTIKLLNELRDAQIEGLI